MGLQGARPPIAECGRSGALFPGRADARFRSKFVNSLMKHGKKTVAERVFVQVLLNLKAEVVAERTGADPSAARQSILRRPPSRTVPQWTCLWRDSSASSR